MTRSENPEQRTRYSYADCLRGDFDPPASEGESTLFQTLFVIGMAVTMILFVNVVVHPAATLDPLALAASFPLWFCIAFTVRSLFANRLSFWLFDKLNPGHLEGVGASALLVLVNVCIMAPIMCAIGVTLSGAHAAAFLGAYATMLPLAAAAAYAFCFLVVRPLVMLVFSDVCKPLIARLRQAG
ncbi:MULTISPECIES: hypothetical protein [Gordonibacter]|uniref:Uncharacterized protein n=1 Tax=Gordonibacter urolithinfaciens TaxID=1335613 RepID=A0A6N8IJM1_9ACTN|nr:MULTISPECIES: hypothetical protein [Gordonibacter]MDN4509777.1 hypothetical protein [Gordonibacter sp. RACS_AR49]MVM56089.1 hypothetical protein [Gordonibacter urolithinfaciens]MVN16071.1 hypothetical protein [Gordonibacter urolithinfaciens]MVN39342.1 hypothetical protein [Gordonibacter urolithinfaciens]MVN56398.1 hypothetical protein [Gordonibacter urolithinfaciens]